MTQDDRRPGRLGAMLAALCVLAPPAAVGGGMLLAPLQAIAGIVAATTLKPRTLLTPAVGLLLAFTLWAALSLAWSAVVRPEQAIKIIGAAATGAALIAAVAGARAADGALIRAGLVAALLVLAAYSAVEAAFDLPLNRLDEPDTAAGILERNPGKGVSILVALVWAGAGALLGGARWRLALAAGLVAAAGALSFQFHMAANAAAFFIGLAGFAFGWAAPRLGPRLAAGVLAAWLLIAPWATPAILSLPGMAQGLPLSWRMRGEIWRFAGERIAEKPLFGWGLDGARQFGDTILQIDGLDFRAIPLHPHSFSVHVWLETGAVGALLLAAAIAGAGQLAARHVGPDRAAGAAFTGAIAAIGAIWNVSYGAWQEWWMAAAFLALAFAAAVRRV